jgi:uncharacterized alkaline shock family protein YloU
VSTAASTAVGDRPTGVPLAAEAGSAHPELGDPADRGSVTIADRAVERIAGHAMTQVEGASAAPRRLLGVSLGGDQPDKEASVNARVDGATVTVDATVAVGYPNSVRAVTARLRTHVRAEVARLTGMHVAHIDVDVVSMRAPAAQPRRVL